MSKEKITVYQKPTCSKCREVISILKDKGFDVTSIDYSLEPLSKAKLRELIGKMNIKPEELLRKNENIYRDLEIDKRSCTDDDIVIMLTHYPQLMQRPIIEIGDRAIVARPPERVNEIL